MKCPFCESENIQEGIPLGHGGDTQPIGLVYRVKILSKTEPLYADLCLECGTVVRTYIKGSTDRKWAKY